MAIVYTTNNGGTIKNFSIIGNGCKFDDNAKIFLQGFFEKNKLNGNDCCVTTYSADPVNIKKGAYVSGNPNGIILEYVFPLSLWEDFTTNPFGISATKYTQVFDNGVWVETTDTVVVMIKGETTVNSKNHVNSFSFSEV